MAEDYVKLCKELLEKIEAANPNWSIVPSYIITIPPIVTADEVQQLKRRIEWLEAEVAIFKSQRIANYPICPQPTIWPQYPWGPVYCGKIEPPIDLSNTAVCMYDFCG